jgi:hypothetical protein
VKKIGIIETHDFSLFQDLLGTSALDQQIMEFNSKKLMHYPFLMAQVESSPTASYFKQLIQTS